MLMKMSNVSMHWKIVRLCRCLFLTNDVVLCFMARWYSSDLWMPCWGRRSLNSMYGFVMIFVFSLCDTVSPTPWPDVVVGCLDSSLISMCSSLESVRCQCHCWKVAFGVFGFTWKSSSFPSTGPVLWWGLVLRSMGWFHPLWGQLWFGYVFLNLFHTLQQPFKLFRSGLAMSEIAAQ